MYPILEKRNLAEGIWLMKVLAPRVARSAQPGQFVIVRVDEHGERIPLTISDFDTEEGSVTIVTQAIGASTRKICALNEGEAFADFAGPLGRPSEFVRLTDEELRQRRFLLVAWGPPRSTRRSNGSTHTAPASMSSSVPRAATC